MSLVALVTGGTCEPVQCVVCVGQVIALHPVRAATVLLDHVALRVIEVFGFAAERIFYRCRPSELVVPVFGYPVK